MQCIVAEGEKRAVYELKEKSVQCIVAEGEKRAVYRS